MSEKTSPLTEDDLRTIILSEIRQSATHGTDNEIVTERERALDYYLSRPRGDEREGYSQVQSTDVFDTIESMLPGLVKIFTGSDEVVSFAPVEKNDDESAKQKTDGVNFVVMKENPWLDICYTWLKDGLLQKNGFVKVYWEDDPKVSYETYTGLTDLEAQLLTDAEEPDEIEVLAHSSYMMENGVPAQQPDPDPNDPTGVLSSGYLHDIEIKRTVNRGRIRIKNIAPEHFIISKGAVIADEARLVAHKERKTISDLRSMGIAEDKLSRLSSSTEINSSEEEYSRWQDQDQMREAAGSSPLDESMREIETIEGYVMADKDGDGIAEMYRFLMGGSVLLKHELWDENPFESFTPIPLPHQFYGRSVADVVRPTQDIKTAIKRNMLDNFYAMNNGGFIVGKNGDVDLDALINRVPGGVALAGDINAVKQMEIMSLPATAFNLMELETAANEARTGQTRYNQGLDADSLNKTARGAQIIQSAAQQRLELTARIFATSVERLFCKVAKLMKKHQDKAKSVRIRNKWVQVDPRTWNDEMDATISVGLSASSKEMDIQRYMNALAAAERVFPLGIISKEGIAKLMTKLYEASGIKSVEEIIIDPAEQQQGQPQQEQPNPEIMKMQAEQQMNQQRLGMEHQESVARFQMDQEKSRAELNNERERTQAEIALEREKAMAETAMQERIKAFEIKTKAMSDIEIARLNAAQNAQDEKQAEQPEQTEEDSPDPILMMVEQNAQAIEAMTMAANAIAMAVQQMNAPKVGTLSNGKTITIQTAPQ